MRRLTLFVGLLVWSGLLCPAPARGGGFSNVDFGTRRVGMLAVIAHPDDPTAIFHNPAGLVLTPGTAAYFSAATFLFDVGIRLYDSQGVLQPDHTISPDTAMGVSPFLAVTSDLGTKRWRVGLAAYAPNVFGTSLPEDEPTRYQALDVMFIAARATASAAVEVDPKLSIGANFNCLMIHMKASRMMNPLVFDDPDRRFDETVWASDSRMELSGFGYTFTGDLGILVRPLPSLDIGAMFASGAPVELEGKVTLEEPSGDVSRIGHTTSLAIPFTLQGGINWKLTDDFEMAADIRYWHYQVLQEQRTELDAPLLGRTEFVDPKNYGNSLNVSFGMLYHVNPEWEFMLGILRDWSPIPTPMVTLDNPNRDRTGVGTGLRWSINEDWRVGAAFERNWYDLTDNQESPTDPPTNAKGWGSNMVLAFDVLWRL